MEIKAVEFIDVAYHNFSESQKIHDGRDKPLPF